MHYNIAFDAFIIFKISFFMKFIFFDLIGKNDDIEIKTKEDYLKNSVLKFLSSSFSKI